MPVKNKSKNIKLKENNILNKVKPYILGCTIGFITFIIGLIISSLILLKTDINNTFIYIIPLIFLFIGSFLCGVKVQHKAGGRGFLTGILSTIPLFFLIILLVSILLNFKVGTFIFITFPICIFGGFFGGITAVNTRF